MLNHTIRHPAPTMWLKEYTIHSQIHLHVMSLFAVFTHRETLLALYCTAKHNCVIREQILTSKPHQANNYYQRYRTGQQQRHK